MTRAEITVYIGSNAAFDVRLCVPRRKRARERHHVICSSVHASTKQLAAESRRGCVCAQR